MWNKRHPSCLRKNTKKQEGRNRAKMGFIFVISGPSGSGKTTLAKKVIKQPQLRNRLIKPVSFTTRPKRPGERHGRDYIFISASDFRMLIKEKKILEHTRYLGYDYGTSCDVLEQSVRKGLSLILCLDIKGALFIKRAYLDRAITIFVKPPSLAIAKSRILARSKKTRSKDADKRIQLAGKEMDYTQYYDYCLLNDNLNSATREISNIIQQALKMRALKNS